MVSYFFFACKGTSATPARVLFVTLQVAGPSLASERMEYKPTPISCRSIHVVSQVHVIIVVPYAFWSILHDSPERLLNPAFGWDKQAGYVHAIACGCVSP